MTVGGRGETADAGGTEVVETADPVVVMETGVTEVVEIADLLIMETGVIEVVMAVTVAADSATKQAKRMSGEDRTI
jgi:hypothetical protein